MNSQFPLFNSLNNKTKQLKEFTHKEKMDIIKDIKSFDKNGHELIYALIKAYDLNDGILNPISFPYEGKQLKTGIKFDFDKFPNKLQNILGTFVEMHKKLE